MPQTPSSPVGASKRCLRACARCRDMKVRCSGSYPCTRCSRKRQKCAYNSDGGLVTVSASYLESLERRAGERNTAPQQEETTFISPPESTAEPSRVGSNSGTLGVTGTGAPSAPVVDHHHSSPATSPADFGRNPLIGGNGSFATDRRGKYWYMGPTSSWAFCQRVLSLIRPPAPEQPPAVEPWALESISIQWTPIGLLDQPQVDGLPSAEYAALLHSTAKYHLGSLYDIVDHESFARQMDHFYKDPAVLAKESRFWYAQFLFVLAFGEAFISGGPAKSSAGLKYASRGLSLLPCIIPLEGNSLAAVEALCLASLYLQALDSRLLAFQMIGQALRLCIIEGWHRDMSPGEVTSSHAARCTNIFWTAYMIDREFGTLIGAPSSIREEDITVKLPNGSQSGSGKSEALALQVKMARLTAMILTGVYGADRRAKGTLLADTQSALRGIAAVDRELLVYLDTRFKGTDMRTSKLATNLILSYHHCVVLATRPLVMCLLHKFMAKVDSLLHLPEGPVVSLLRSCTCSALNILRTLRALGESNIDHFLSFQLEAAFSSALMLCILDSLLPGFTADGGTWLQAIHEILDGMIAKGSPAAPLRKRELGTLNRALDAYSSRAANQVHQTPSRVHQDSDTTLESDTTFRSEGPITATSEATALGGFASWGSLEQYGDFTLSSTDMADIANGLQAEDFILPE